MHPQTKAVGVVIDYPDARAGVDRALGCPLHFNQVSPARTEAAPLVGAHTGEVLAGFGFSEEEIRALLGAGAAFQPQRA